MRAKKSYPQEKIDEALKLREKDLSFAKIGKKLKVPVGTVRSWVIRNSKPQKKMVTEQEVTKSEYTNDDFTNEFKQKIIDEILASGKPVRAIALSHNLPYHKVYEWYRKYTSKNKLAKKVRDTAKAAAKVKKERKGRNPFPKVCKILADVRPKVSANKELEMLKARNEYLLKVINLYDIKVD